ncbi:hypothetical protein ACQUSR_09865 [Streptomyces sp. P1-3]
MPPVIKGSLLPVAVVREVEGKGGGHPVKCPAGATIDLVNSS